MYFFLGAIVTSNNNHNNKTDYIYVLWENIYCVKYTEYLDTQCIFVFQGRQAMEWVISHIKEESHGVRKVFSSGKYSLWWSSQLTKSRCLRSEHFNADVYLGGAVDPVIK